MPSALFPAAASAELHTAGRAIEPSELEARVLETARWLRASGVAVLAWQLDNGLEWIVLDLACIAAEVVAVPLPGYFTAAQLDHAIRDSGADLIVLEHVSTLSVLEGAAVVAGLPDVIASRRVYRLSAVRVRSLDAVAKITYTSGTTGAPRGVCLTQNALNQVAQSLLDATRSLDLRSHLCLLPLATLLENVAGVQAPLAGGMRVVAPPLAQVGLLGGACFDVSRALAALAEFRPNSIILLPQMLLALVHALERGARVPSDVRFVAVGGARVPVALLERASRVGLPIHEGYGLSECASVVALNRPGAHRPGSVGRPLPHARVRIAEDGEILVSGAAMRGYLGHAPHADGWVATGDIGSLDADGFLYVRGRKKNVFITSFGRNVSPEWIESELMATGAITQALVDGEARPWNVALIVAAADRLAVRDAIDRANRALPDYARVREWILADTPWTVTNQLATANGRPRREAILAAYADRIAALYARRPHATC